MPSEKMRYMRARHGPDSPIEFNDLLRHLRSFGIKDLSEILWIRAQHDDLLRRILTVTAAIPLCAGDFKKGKSAIDFALYLPDFVTYDIENGYGQLLDAIHVGIERLADDGDRASALQLAQYAIEQAQAALERFAEGRDWRCAIERLCELAEKLSTESKSV